MEISEVPGCRAGGNPIPYLAKYHAPVLRIVVDDQTLPLGIAQCAAQARAAGYKVHVVIQWNDDWTVAQARAFASRVLAAIPSAWAVSLGNEQELDTAGPAETSEDYRARWLAMEPLVRAADPRAIIVGGEVAPWSLIWLEATVALGLPGMQAVAAHVYRFHCFAISTFERWAESEHLPYWFDEGLDVPGAWDEFATRPESQLLGASVVGAWL